MTPPAYTAKPPVILPGIRAGEPHQAALIQTVPAGSVLVIRASGASRLEVVTSGGIAEASRENAPAPRAGTVEHRYTIGGQPDVALEPGGEPVLADSESAAHLTEKLQRGYSLPGLDARDVRGRAALERQLPLA